MSLLRRTAVVGALGALALACGQTTSSRPTAAETAGSSAMAGGGTADGADAQGTVAIADNGVAIPMRAPQDSCDGLGIQTRPCEGSGVCDSLGCDCSSRTAMPSEIDCGARACIVAIDCAAYCSIEQAAKLTAPLCASSGLCDDGAACPDGERCVRPPGATSGSCSNADTNARCYADDDCRSGACVVGDVSGNGHCDDGTLCNRAEHCGNEKCVLPAGRYLGFCTNGENGSPCLSAADCSSGFGCALVFLNSFSGAFTCTDGAVDSPCATSADCSPGLLCAEAHVCSAGSSN